MAMIVSKQEQQWKACFKTSSNRVIIIVNAQT